MEAVIVLAVLIIGVYVLVKGSAAALSSAGDSSGSSDDDRTRYAPDPGSPYDYRLEYRDAGPEYGRGYVVVRNEDGQALRWRTLPRSEGLEAIGVAGESHHMNDLQDSGFEPGSELALVPEPDNPVDENAIAVYDASRERQAGYVPSDEAERIGRKLQREDLKALSMWEVHRQGERSSLRLLLVSAEASLDAAIQ